MQAHETVYGITWRHVPDPVQSDREPMRSSRVGSSAQEAA